MGEVPERRRAQVATTVACGNFVRSEFSEIADFCHCGSQLDVEPACRDLGRLLCRRSQAARRPVLTHPVDSCYHAVSLSEGNRGGES